MKQKLPVEVMSMSSIDVEYATFDLSQILNALRRISVPDIQGSVVKKGKWKTDIGRMKLGRSDLIFQIFQ